MGSAVRRALILSSPLPSQDDAIVDTLDDEYFSGLSCSMYDDDGEYPNPQVSGKYGLNRDQIGVK